MLRKLFLIDGLAGTGKSDLLEYVERTHSRDAAIIAKFSTRKKRRVEEAAHTDLRFVSEKKFADLASADFYSYSYAGAKYGFSKASVVEALESHEFVFIIVRSRSLVETIGRDFGEIAVVVPVFVYADRDLVAARLKRDGFDEASVKFRMTRSAHSWNDYLEYPDSSIRVLLNNSERTDFHRRINSLLSEFSSDRVDPPTSLHINPAVKFDLIKPLMGFKQDMYRHLTQSPYEKNIFVMMKFRDNNAKLYRYMKAEIERAGYRCVRADAPEWNITNNVYNPLAVLYCCKFGIALFDEAEPDQAYNANVAYELATMHYQGKQCLILKHVSLPDVPFDLVKDLRKVYAKDLDFEELFSQWLVEIDRG